MDFIVLCSYCARRRIDGVWIDSLPPPAGALVSHGICETCYDRVMAELDAEIGVEEGK